MSEIRGWAAAGAGEKLKPISFDPGPLGAEEVEVAVEHCGLCHSDLSVLLNEWQNSIYPCVLGHEIVGRVVAVGEAAKGVKVGQRVGIGWYSNSCLSCHQCMSGKQHLCAQGEATIIGHRGGFAERTRAHWSWVIPLPDQLDISSAGPLLCGGITVFSPLHTYGIKPTDSVGVVGIGGLGHMAIKFAHAWGCQVTAFTSSDSKAAEARSFGADRILSSHDKKQIADAAGSLDMLLITVNVSLDWPLLLSTLKSEGRLHVVGAVLEPMGIPAFSLINGQKTVSGSPTGSPTTISTMLEFAARKGVAPQVEHFPMSKLNEAFEHLKAGKARYRIVLDADF